MKRVTDIKPASAWNLHAACDFVLLDAQDRHRRRVVFVGEHGATYLLDLASPAQLRDGDGLLLEDGSVVRVSSKAEALVEVTAATTDDLARMAWHLGNRHTEVQIVANTLHIRRDHVLEEMLRGLGASLSYLDAPFDPETGAYNHHGHGHG